MTMRIPSPIAIIAYAEIRRSGKPFAVDMMMNPWTAYSRDSMQHPLQPVIQIVTTLATKWICWKANGVSYVTERILQEQYPCRAMKYGETKDYFTAHFSTINLNDNHFSRKEWPEEKPEPLVLVHTGKMADYRKGHDIFIDVVKILNNRGVPTKGIMIGDGQLRSTFEEYAHKNGVDEHIEFVGWLAGFSAVQQVLQRGHVFLYPTKSEGLPRAVIEAMASGLVVIASAVDEIPELIPKTLTCKEITPEAFVERVEYLMDNWNLAHEIREQNSLKAREYHIDILSKRRREFYEELKNCSLQSSNF